MSRKKSMGYKSKPVSYDAYCGEQIASRMALLSLLYKLGIRSIVSTYLGHYPSASMAIGAAMGKYGPK